VYAGVESDDDEEGDDEGPEDEAMEADTVVESPPKRQAVGDSPS
jgi:hypothetical protein